MFYVSINIKQKPFYLSLHMENQRQKLSGLIVFYDSESQIKHVTLTKKNMLQILTLRLRPQTLHSRHQLYDMSRKLFFKICHIHIYLMPEIFLIFLDNKLITI